MRPLASRSTSRWSTDAGELRSSPLTAAPDQTDGDLRRSSSSTSTCSIEWRCAAISRRTIGGKLASVTRSPRSTGSRLRALHGQCHRGARLMISKWHREKCTPPKKLSLLAEDSTQQVPGVAAISKPLPLGRGRRVFEAGEGATILLDLGARE